MARSEKSSSLASAVTRVFDALEALETHPEATEVEKRAAAFCHMAMEPVHARSASRILGCRIVDATGKIAGAVARLTSGTAFGGRVS